MPWWGLSCLSILPTPKVVKPPYWALSSTKVPKRQPKRRKYGPSNRFSSVLGPGTPFPAIDLFFRPLIACCPGLKQRCRTALFLGPICDLCATPPPHSEWFRLYPLGLASTAPSQGWKLAARNPRLTRHHHPKLPFSQNRPFYPYARPCTPRTPLMGHPTPKQAHLVQ